MKSKYVPYPADGTGRDRYIGYNNGGFFDKNKSISVDKNNKETATAFVTKLNERYAISPSIKAPNFHYHGDGTGRDSYILSNGGGLFYDSRSLNSYHLTDFLRNNDPSTTKSNTIETSKCSQLQMRYIKFLRENQKSVIKRLYESEKNKKKKLRSNLGEELDNSIENSPIKNDNQNLILPKLENKQTRCQTDANMKDINEILGYNYEDAKKNEKSDIFKKSNFQTISHELSRGPSHEYLLKSVEKLTKYDANKKYKKDNQNFYQAYLHLRNANYNALKI